MCDYEGFSQDTGECVSCYEDNCTECNLNSCLECSSKTVCVMCVSE